MRHPTGSRCTSPGAWPLSLVTTGGVVGRLVPDCSLAGSATTASWPQPQIRQRRCSEALRSRIVRHLAKPRVAAGVPLQPRLLDLLMGSRNEVPPHDDLLLELQA